MMIPTFPFMKYYVEDEVDFAFGKQIIYWEDVWTTKIQGLFSFVHYVGMLFYKIPH